MNAVIAKPAYWAFCWGSGLATARWLLAEPQWVAGKSVLDLGTGSGVVAIAANLAGARRVIACDNDTGALSATEHNSRLNQVELELCDDLYAASDVDVMFLADVLYDRANFPLIELAKQKCQTLIIADSRIKDVEDSSFRLFHELEATTLPNLGEFEEFRTVRFFLWQAS